MVHCGDVAFGIQFLSVCDQNFELSSGGTSLSKSPAIMRRTRAVDARSVILPQIVTDTMGVNPVTPRSENNLRLPHTPLHSVGGSATRRRHSLWSGMSDRLKDAEC